MKVLFHCCCAPCTVGCLTILRNLNPVLFWYNPNIHPYTEYKARKNALENFARENGGNGNNMDNMELIIKDYYGLREFLRGTLHDLENKCGFCYNLRLGECAKFAAENNFEAFSSTLLVSPWQDHEKIKETGGKCAERYNIKFFYADFRGNFYAGKKQARENNIYMQKYCGCIFSEEERYSVNL